MNDLARIIEHMTAAAEKHVAERGMTPAQLLQRDMQQAADFDEWQREVDAVGESAEMEGLDTVMRNDRETIPIRRNANCIADGLPDSPSLPPPADDFSFDPACRELAAHFMPDSDAIGLDYMAQHIQEAVEEYLAAREEMK